MTEFTPTPLSFVFVVSALLLLLFSAYVLLKPHASLRDPVTATLVFTLLAAFLWAGPYSLQLMAQDLTWKLWWFNLAQLGASLLALGLFLHVSTYSGHFEWFSGWRLGLFAIEPASTAVLILTDSYHSLLRTDIELVEVGSTVVMHRGIGPWWFVRSTYLYLLTAAALLIVVVSYRRAGKMLRRQLLLGALAIVFPLVVNMVFDSHFLMDAINLGGMTEIEFTGAALGVSGIILTFSVVRYRLLDIVPIGRRVAIDKLHDPYVVIDRGMRIVDYNPIFASLAVNDGTVLGADIVDTVPELADLIEPTDHVLTDEIRIDRRGSSWFHVQVVPLVSEDRVTRTGRLRVRTVEATDEGDDAERIDHGTAREVTAYVLTFRNITERKHRERLLERQNEQLELLNRIVSHDIHNEMDLVLGITRRVRTQLVELPEDGADSPGVPDEALAYLDQILTSNTRVVDLTETARDLVEALADFDAELEPVPLRPVLETELLNAMSHDDVTVEVRGEIPDVSVVANELLSSVFRNILTNAIVHNDKPAPSITIDVDAPADSVTIAIADNGPGIPPAQRDSLFEEGEFVRTARGWGFGLYLVRTLVDQYGGALSVTENELEGTTVLVELRASERGQAA